jgi:UDP-3-O-[3-hydroxymyristoyl] N-acetylglucosamine deacetylase
MTTVTDDIRYAQHTLKTAITYVGRGLHTGHKVSMRLAPAAPDSGVRFVRRDMPANQAIVLAHWNHVTETRLGTVLGNVHGVRVGTAEHLLAALYACGVDNATIELDAPEVPIVDGSAEPYVSLIHRVGTVVQEATRRAILIRRPLAACDGDKFAVLLPSPSPRVTMEIDFPGYRAIGRQRLSLPLDEATFAAAIAPARTFGFASEVAALRTQGYALGGSLRNAILVDRDGVVNEEGLRFPDEFVRHKILDAIGDLSLAGAPIIGHYSGHKAGHGLNVALLHELFADRDAWSYVTVFEAQQPETAPQTGAAV